MKTSLVAGLVMLGGTLPPAALHGQDAATPAGGQATDTATTAEATPPQPAQNTASIGDSQVVLTMTPADFDERMSQGLEFAQALQALPIPSGSVDVMNAPVFLGDQLIPEGRYSLAFWKYTDGNWEVILYQAPGGITQFSGLERHYRVPATVVSDAEPALAQFQLAFAEVDGNQTLEFGGGPMRVRVDTKAVSMREQVLSLNGNDAIAVWYERESADVGEEPLLIGDIDLTIGNRNCPMQVYVTCADDTMTAMFRSAGRHSAEQAHSFFTTMVNAVQGGHPFLRDYERRAMREEMKLELFAALPDKLSFEGQSRSLEQTTGLQASFVPLGRRTLLDVQVGKNQAEIVIDDSQFTLREES